MKKKEMELMALWVMMKLSVSHPSLFIYLGAQLDEKIQLVKLKFAQDERLCAVDERVSG